MSRAHSWSTFAPARAYATRRATAMLLMLVAVANTMHAQARGTPERNAPSPLVTLLAQRTDTLTTSFEVDGIPVILRRAPANDVVAANVYLLGGTRQLTPSTQGIELLLLESSEQGTAKYPRDSLRRRMARMGSVIGVGPTLDWTVMGLRSTVAHFDSTWAILTDRLVAPRLDSASVEQVRTQILSGVQQRGENPDALLSHMADSAAFVAHHYGLSPIGSTASPRTISLQQIRQYHAEQMVRSRLMIVIVGNVDRERVTRLVRTTMSTLPLGEYTWRLPTAPTPRPSGATFAMRRLPTNYLQGVFVGPDARSKDYAALRLASAILAGRLFAEVRERNNLTYAIDAPFREHAIGMGGLYVTTTQPDAVLGIMQREIRMLQQNVITDDALDRLVQQFIVTYFLDNETNADQADMLARAALYQGDYRRADQFVDDLRAVTPEDIRQAAVRYIRNIRWAFIGDAMRVDRRAFERF
jgi:zinc protease